MSVHTPGFRDIHRVGLTGGIGSGKTTVGRMLAAHGAAVIDADQLSKAVTDPGGSAIASIRHTFGPEFITENGALNRSRMRDLVFTNISAKRQLEAIIHPQVGNAIQQACTDAIAYGTRLLVLDIPLLVESDRWLAPLDAIVVVDCQPATQVTRVQQRSGLSTDVIHSIMQSQATRKQRNAAADFVIYNESISLTNLQSQVAQIAVMFGL